MSGAYRQGRGPSCRLPVLLISTTVAQAVILTTVASGYLTVHMFSKRSLCFAMADDSCFCLSGLRCRDGRPTCVRSILCGPLWRVVDSTHRYDLGALLGAGVYGKVYSATFRGTSGAVALKVSDRPPVFRCVKAVPLEAILLRLLAHQHVVTLYELAVDGTTRMLSGFVKCLNSLRYTELELSCV